MRLKVRFGLVDPAAEAPVADRDRTSRDSRSGDLAALTRVLVNWLIMIAAVWIATAVVPGIVVNGGLGTYLAISLLFGLVNAVLGPVLYWLAGSQSWLRLGGSALIVNGILFAATAGLSPNLDIGGLGGAVLGALVVARGQHPARAGVPPHPGGLEQRDLTRAAANHPARGRTAGTAEAHIAGRAAAS